jgi:NADH:ubiquinone oxidoreductase subunit 6 (subunit J)
MLLAAINYHSLFFLLFALLACGFAAAVLFSSNIVRMAFYLTLSLGATSALFFLAGAEFVGAMQLMIYVGGTLVLLIFGVMLTAQAKFISMQTSAAEWVLAAIVGCSLLVLLVRGAVQVPSWTHGRSDRQAIATADSQTSTPIGLALAGVRVDKLDETNPVLRHGMSGYLLPFVIVSMHLLVVLIGAGYMARTKVRSVRVAPAAAPAIRENRRHSWAVTGGLVTGGVVNAVLAAKAFYFAGGGKAWSPVAEGGLATSIERMNDWVAGLPAWLLPALGVLFVVNVLLMLVVYGWQKWGVIGLVLVPVVQAICLFNARQPAAAVILAVVLLAPVALLISLICSGGPRSEWSRMD